MRTRTKSMVLAGWLVAIAMPAGAAMLSRGSGTVAAAGADVVVLPAAGVPEVLPIFLVGTGLIALSVAMRRTT